MEHKKIFLLNENGACGWTAIHEAIHQNDQKMLKFLLNNPCDPNIVSFDEHTPLQLAIGLDANSLIQ
jgi:ankyrin repeat protein